MLRRSGETRVKTAEALPKFIFLWKFPCMNISYNWLRHFLETDLDPESMAALLTDIGLEVEGVEKTETLKGGLEGIVIGQVLRKEKHPDADRLSVTLVDVAQGEPLQIVCGAPNVDAGQKVVVALPGAVLYPSEGESFRIKKSKIRGVESNGMICAEDEIGLGKSHEGIMVLDPDVVTGTPAADFFQVKSDYCISIGLTPNRVDAASHYGVARDLYAACLQRGVAAVFHKPEVSPLPQTIGHSPIRVKVAEPESCLRYSSLFISGITVAPSPVWLQDRLRAVGIKPLNNVVDVTNFVLHELGQPLHAFDADRLAGGEIVVRRAKAGELLTTLDGIERKLDPEDLLIADTEKALCLAGVLGGADSGVRENTVSLFLESAYFDPASVRKSARRHGINTDSSFRFERGADPEMVPVALRRAAQLILEVAGGEIQGEAGDIYPVPITPFRLKLRYARVQQLAGIEIFPHTLKEILASLEIRVLAEEEGALELEVPAYRVDVQREVDVIEEVLRIYGYNRVEIPTRFSLSVNQVPVPDRDKVQLTVSELLSSNGCYEIFCNSLTSSHYVKWADTPALREEENVKLLNPLSTALDVMRQSMLFGALEAVAYNRNRQQNDLRFYEFGKTYRFYENRYEESAHLSICLTGRRERESWNATTADVSFYTLKAMVHLVLDRLGLSTSVQVASVGESVFEEGLSYTAGGKPLVEFGRVKSTLVDRFDIRKPVYYADFQWDNLLLLLRRVKVSYREVSRFPFVRRDLSLLIGREVKFSEIESLSRQTEKKLLREVNLFDVYEGKNLAEGKKSYAVSFVLGDESQTLTDTAIDKAMERIRTALEEKLGAQLR